MTFQQVKSTSWLVEKMADGSIAVIDQQSKETFFLNATAAAAWEAANAASVAEIARRMSARLNAVVGEDLALTALTSLEDKGLVESTDVTGRRSVLKRIGIAAGIAGPVVLAMTVSEQKAQAAAVGSGRGV